MTFKRKKLCMALAASLIASVGSAQAVTSEEAKLLRDEINKLRSEIAHMKAGGTAGAGELQGRVEQLELNAKEAVVAGDFPGSLRLPGSETSFRIYGFAELNAVHEFKGDNTDVDYATFLPYVPLEGSPGANRKGATYLTARTSRLGIEVNTPSSYGPINMKLGGDFNNEPRTGNSAVTGTVANILTQQATNSYGFRLRHAYGQFAGFLVGQTWSTFMDLDSLPETVDFNGQIGATFIRQPQVRYSHPTKDYGTFTVAVENSLSYVLDDTGSVTTAGFSRVPDLVARWDKRFNWGALSLRVVTHENRLNDGGGVSLSERGFGFAASGTYKVTGDDTFMWSFTGGKGIGRYLNYVEGALYDASTRSIYLEKAAGVVLGWQHRASESLRYNVAAGFQKNARNAYTEFAERTRLNAGRFGINGTPAAAAPRAYLESDKAGRHWG